MGVEYGHGHERSYQLLAVVTILGVALHLAGYNAEILLAIASIIVSVNFILGLREKKFTVDLLMAIVGFVTLRHGMIFEGLIVLFLYSLAETIEEIVEGVARKRILAVASLIPTRVVVEEDGTRREIRVEELRPGMTVLVRVGEAVPADSEALSSATLDMSLVTGEPHPVRVRPGERIPSGALVLEGPLRARVISEPGESYAQKLVREAAEALERKPRITRLLERYAPHITVVVLGIYAVLHELVGPTRGLVALLVGCPSAYIISSSYSTSLAIAGLARRGALVQSGEVLEKLWKYDVVVLDKTGTLTTLHPDPEASWTTNGANLQEALTVIAGAARASRHPVARALAQLSAHGEAVEVREVRGLGLLGEGLEILPGPEHPCGKTVLARAGSVEAVICLREVPMPGAKELVEYLRRRGVRVIIASGDSEENVARAARALGVEEYYSRMKPQDKAELIRRLQSQDLRVVFAGDGVNDTIAIAQADVGIAVGDVDIARQAADAVAPHGAPQVLEILRAGEAHKRMIASSFVSATIVKLAAGALGLAGMISLPVVALLGDDGSTLSGVATATITGAASRGR